MSRQRTSKPSTTTRAAMPEALKRRVTRLGRQMREEGVDVLIVTNPLDIRYLTGFVGDDSWALISARSNAVTVLTDGRFAQQVAQEAPHAKAVIRKGPMVDALAGVLKQRKANKIGFQPAHVSVALRNRLVKQFGAKQLKGIDTKLGEQRAVKTEQELRAIRKAVSIQQRAFSELCEFIEPGQTEAQVCAYLEYRIRALGADGISFPSIVAVDGNAAMPHAVPGRTKLNNGCSVLIDWGAKWNGYCSDLTRVIALGSMSRRMRAIYQVVLEAQQAAIEQIKAGVKGSEVDAAARKVIADAGYKDAFTHSLGHGIGLEVHERPALVDRNRLKDPKKDFVLQAGQVVTVEPGVYLPEIGGVRIEDDVLVTEIGCKVLSDLPKSLDAAII